MNRDLTRRVKSISVVTWARKVLLNDVKLLRKLIQTLDQRSQLWEYAPGGGERRSNGRGEEDEEFAVGEMEMETEEIKVQVQYRYTVCTVVGNNYKVAVPLPLSAN